MRPRISDASARVLFSLDSPIRQAYPSPMETTLFENKRGDCYIVDAGEQQAVRKASGARLLADMARAAYLLDCARAFAPSSLRAYILGALEAESSLTVRACLLTAWGC